MFKFQQKSFCLKLLISDITLKPVQLDLNLFKLKTKSPNYKLMQILKVLNQKLIYFITVLKHIYLLVKGCNAQSIRKQSKIKPPCLVYRLTLPSFVRNKLCHTLQSLCMRLESVSYQQKKNALGTFPHKVNIHKEFLIKNK